VKVSRQELLTNLTAVQPGLGKNEFVQQSTYFVFTGGFVMAYNDQVRVMTETCAKDIEGAVPGDTLFKLLSKMEEDEIGIEAGEQVLKITGKGKEAEIPMNPEILIPVADLEDESGEDGWFDLPETFADSLKLVGFSVLDDTHDMKLTCIHFTPEYIESNDSFRVTRIAVELPDCDSLVPYTSLSKLADYGTTAVKFTENWVHFKCANGTMYSCKQHVKDENDPYPDMSKVLKVKGTELVFPKELPAIMERAGVFITAKSSRERMVEVTISGGKFTVAAKGENGRFKEYCRVKFAGKDCSFWVNTDFLLDIFKLNPTATIGDNRMVFQSEGFAHALCIVFPDKE